MTAAETIEISRQAIIVLLKLGAPVMMIAEKASDLIRGNQ